MRTFETGATRDADDSKYDFEGFLSPLVLERFAEYMHKHRKQADGGMRASDNWQKGIPLDAYMKSGFRHFRDWWRAHRGYPTTTGDNLEDELCAILFNVQGYLHEHLKVKYEYEQSPIYVGPLGDFIPDLGNRVQRLFGQHPMMAEALREQDGKEHAP